MVSNGACYPGGCYPGGVLIMLSPQQNYMIPARFSEAATCTSSKA